MTWEQEIQLAAATAAKEERERSQKIIAEKDRLLAEQARRIAELEAQVSKK